VKIAFVTPELLSLVRRTNLAGVSESLARSLGCGGADVRVFLPRTYDVLVEDMEQVNRVAEVSVPDGPRGQLRFFILEGRIKGLRIYLFENDELFSNRHPYGDDEGPYQDNWRRYALFTRAVLESLTELSFEPDLFHCMDWTTGLLPVLHQVEYAIPKRDHPATRAGTYFAIHNLAMQGVFEREILAHIGLPHSLFHNVGGIECGGKVNFLKAGAEFATVIGTHSAIHAEKIQEKDRGYGLEATFVRRSKEIVGITNGIDYMAWDPAVDPLLPAQFSAKDKDIAGKRRCKSALQTSLQLDVAPRTPIACSMGRWDADSGFDLFAEILTPVLERGIELVIMGSGQNDVRQRLQTMEGTFMGRCRVIEGYDAPTAHRMMAGSDFLILPSHYNPSNSLFAVAMRYGVAPIVYAKSGLEELVVDAAKDPEKGTGFHFDPYTSVGLLESIEFALKAYRSATSWKKMVRRCLELNFSWEACAAEYIKAYRRVTRRTRARLKAD